MESQDILTLKNELKNLKDELEFYQKKCFQQEQAYNALMKSLHDFRRHRFGARSEKFIDKIPRQLDIFSNKKISELKPTEKNETDASNIIDIKPYQRRKKKLKRFLTGLPTREVIIPANKDCLCGNEKSVIRYEITQLFHYQPPVYEVVVQKREVVVCVQRCESSIAIAANPIRILPKAGVTSALLAHIVVSKLYDRQPHYHFEKRLRETTGIELHRSKLSRWFIETSLAVQPLVNLMKEQIIDYDVAFCDPTFLQVLREPGRSPTTKSYLFCIRGGPPQKQSTLYEYNATEHKEFLANWFAEFMGYLHVDGQNIYDGLVMTSRIKLVGCNSHSRRYFEKIARQISKTDGLSHDAMRFYKKIYRLEREAKGLLTPEAKKQFRLEHMWPLFVEFKIWLEHEVLTTLPKSPLGEAFQYSIHHWDDLTRFFEDGRLSLDNNRTEQLIRYLVMARKAFLFATSIEGAKAIANHLSLIVTALEHNLEPYAYFVKVFDQLPYCKTVMDIEALLPWNIDVPKVNLLKVA